MTFYPPPDSVVAVRPLTKESVNNLLNHKRTIILFIAASIAIHLMVLLSMGRFGRFNFTTPVKMLTGVTVDLSAPSAEPPANAGEKNVAAESVPDDTSDAGNAAPTVQADSGAFIPAADTPPVKQAVVEPAAGESTRPTPPPAPKRVHHTLSAIPPLRTAAEFLSVKSEKLTYLITVFGIPVASAELEASNMNGELKISLKTRSTVEMSSFYSVDNLIETRHVGGDFIVSRFKQHEGSLIRDTGFTLFLRDKRVFWVDRTRNRYADEKIPNGEVLDILSSLYLLRNRPLQVGKSELLHVYDGENYAPITLDIVRQEEIRMRNLQKMDTLQLHYDKQGGVFKRTGNVTAWFTNDENRVPIRIEASAFLGNITAELISSEITPAEVSK